MIKKMLVCILQISILLSVCSYLGYANTDDKVILYVAKDGSDKNEGTEISPFSTLDKARDTIRQIKKSVGIKNGAVVYIREGVYEMKNSFDLDSSDSGTADAPIVYRSYPGEKVVLVGGRDIDGTKFEKVTDTSILSRIIDKSSSDKILQVDLKSMGITNFGELNLPGSASLPWVPKLPNPPEVFFNDEAMMLARYPNDTYITIKNVVNSGANPRMWEDDKKNDADYVPVEKRNKNDNFSISYEDERINKWSSAKDILLHGFWYWDWADQTVPVASIDSKKQIITSTLPSYYSIKQNQKYYAYNLLEEIDKAGEYYLDRQSGILYLYPPADIRNAHVRLSLLSDNIINLKKTSHIEIKDIDFSSTRSMALRIENGEDNKIIGCSIDNTGDKAIYVSGYRNGVISCKLLNTNGGIYVDGGIRESLTPGENYIENNDIGKYARITKMYNAAVSISGVGNRVSYNKIYDADHLAIMFYGNDNKIEYNEIFNVLKDTDDAGAIYGGRDWTYRGNEIKYNYIHDLKSVTNGINGVHAIYLDDAFSSAVVAGNVIENVSGFGVFLGGGRDNVVYNNVMVNTGGTIHIDDRGVGWMSAFTQPNGGLLYQRLDEVPYKEEPWKSKYPKLYTILENEPAKPIGNIVQNNLLVKSGAMQLEPIAKSKTLLENNLITQDDPGFYDFKSGNYLLKQDAKVFTKVKGFQQIPFTRMGNYTERASMRVKNAVILCINSPKALVNREAVYIDNNNFSKTAQMINGTTYVPLRFISENIGVKVNWDSDTSQITLNSQDKTTQLILNQLQAIVNGTNVELSAAPMLIGDSAYVPIRDISNILGKFVFWDSMGLVAISDQENLFNPSADKNIIADLYERLTMY